MEPSTEAYFAGYSASHSIFLETRKELLGLDHVTERTTRSQVAYWSTKPFAWLWIPARYLHNRDLAPLVLTIGLLRRDESDRWKEVVEPQPGRFIHHLELRGAGEIDEQMRAILKEALRTVGSGEGRRRRSHRG